MKVPGRSPKKRPKSSFVYTSFLELVRVINQLTEDDNLVVAAVRDILNRGRARAVRSMTRVRVAGGHAGG